MRSKSSLGAVTVIQNEEELCIIHVKHAQPCDFHHDPCEDVCKTEVSVRSPIFAAMTTLFYY